MKWSRQGAYWYDDEALSRAASERQQGEGNSNAKLTCQQALRLRARAQRGESTYALAAEYGISQAQVCRIKNGQRWARVTEGTADEK